MPSIFIRIDEYDKIVSMLEKALHELDTAERLLEQIEAVQKEESDEITRMKQDLTEAREKNQALLTTLKSHE